MENTLRAGSLFHYEAQPSSLQELCLEEVCAMPTELYMMLPWTLKDQLLSKLTRRGRCNDAVFSWLLHSHVTDLDLSYCTISDAAIESLELASCLKTLFLPKPPVVDRSHFSENSLIRLGIKKSNLRVVALNGLSGVTDRVIGSLVGGCPQLEELYISSTAITNHALIVIANLTQLLRLHIAKTQVNDIGIHQLVSGGVSHTLLELHIEGCARLTDESIESICRYCCHLNSLHFYNCPRLSDRSRDLVSEHMAERTKHLAWSAN